MLAVNETLQNRYRITRQLGHGGMGAVYEAIDERFGEPIALKEILNETVNEKQKSLFAKAFEREAKSLAKAKHEVIPFVRDYFFERNRQFLVMELVEGDDLSKLLENRKNAFPLEDTLRWLDQLLDALDYLHNLTPPIIHRDIKPQNLKLNYRRKIKLLDFGIAKNTDATATTTTNHTFIGATLNYSPTEQILRVIDSTFREYILLKHKEKAEKILNQNTDARCDLYALGATFYHLLTNHLPVDSVKRTLEVWEDKKDPLIVLTKLNPNIPSAISDCLMKAMEIERDNRFSTAIEMQKALQAAIREETNNTSNISGQTEQEYLLVTEEIRQNQISETAKTANILDEEQIKTANILEAEKLKTKADENDFSDIPPLPTQLSIAIVPETNISAEFRSTVPLVSKSSKVSADTKSPEFLEEIVTGNKKNLFWVLPLIFLAVLTVSGIVGTFWVLNPNPAVPDSSITNVAASPSPISTQMTEAKVENTNQTNIAENTTATPETSELKPTPKKNIPPPTAKTSQSKPTVKTNVRATRTPKPKSQKSSTIGPCAFTDDCK